ncbi:MAG: SpoIIE family protein phosphatase [Planctomycetota bacterium]
MERPMGGARRPAPGGTSAKMGGTGQHRAVRPAPGHTPAGTPPPSDTSHLRRTDGGHSAGHGGGHAAGPARSPGTSSGSLGGMGLGAKFALFIALTVAIASSFLVVGGYYSVAKEMDQEIDEAGVRLTKLAAATAWPIIKKHMDAGDDNPREKLLENLNNMVKLVDPTNQPAYKKLDDENRNKWLKAILESSDIDPYSLLTNSTMELETPEIINIIILLPNGRDYIASMKRDPITLGNPTPRAKIGGVEIQEGIYSSGNNVRVRLFKKPVLDQNGTERGTVQVYLKAAKIDAAKSHILTAMMIPLLFAIVIGAGIGFYLSTIVTKPLKTLISDIQIVSQGDLEHETKARSTDEIGYLARTFNLMTKSLAVAHTAELQTKAMEHELSIAVDIQSNLLPKRIPKIPKFEIGAYYRPSKEVGGDYYDFIQIDQNHLGVIVADVSGKGIPGSMVMTMARSLIRMEAERNLSTADTLIKTNRILARDIRRGMFVTCLYALIDVQKNSMLVSSAGHNPMVVYRKATNKYELINPNGIALGFDKGPIFERTIKEQSIPYGPGDRFVLYTDGVVEAMSPRNVEFGDERFYKMVQTLADKDSNVFINTIVKALDDHQGDGEQHDDITLVTVRVLG